MSAFASCVADFPDPEAWRYDGLGRIHVGQTVAEFVPFGLRKLDTAFTNNASE